MFSGLKALKASALLVLGALAAPALPAAADVTVASPNGKVRFVLSPGAQGRSPST